MHLGIMPPIGKAIPYGGFLRHTGDTTVLCGVRLRGQLYYLHRLGTDPTCRKCKKAEREINEENDE